MTEAYAYDAEGTRVMRTRNGVATAYLGGLVEEDVPGNATRTHYGFHGQVVAQRQADGTVVYLHGNHLGSVAVTTSDSGAVVSRQDFTP